jgi:hypothetical protein
MSDEQKNDAENSLPEDSEDQPQLFALTRQPGGYHLSRRSFLAAASMAAIASSGALQAAEPGNPAGTAGGSRGGRILLNDPKDAIKFRAHKGAVNSLAFLPEGSMLASGGKESVIRLWSLPSGELSAKLERRSSSINSIAFSADGSMLASGNNDKTINLWKMPQREFYVSLEGHSNLVKSVAFSPDGNILASGSADKTVRLWSLPKGDLILELKEHASCVNSVAYRNVRSCRQEFCVGPAGHRRSPFGRGHCPARMPRLPERVSLRPILSRSLRWPAGHAGSRVPLRHAETAGSPMDLAGCRRVGFPRLFVAWAVCRHGR